ncbi:MAG: sensor histidine kinase [Sphaerochaeta sp.]
MKDDKYSNKRNLRLFIVLLYQLLGLPFQFWIMNIHNNGAKNFLINIILFSIFIAFEIIEYLLKYPYKTNKVVKVLFFIRFSTIIFAFLCNYQKSRSFDPYLYTFITLLAFYSYFMFPGKVSAIITFILAFLTILFDTKNFFYSNLEVYYGVLLVVQRAITIMIFYLFAKFWDADRTVSYKNDQLLLALNAREAELKKYAREIAKTSILEERTRIARDMHDSVGHSLTAIQIQLRTADAFLDVDKKSCKKAIESALDVASNSLQDTRAVLNDLRESDNTFSLKQKIKPIVKILEQSGIKVTTKISDDNDNMNYASLIALFRFVQESSTNIIKHSNATEATIELSYNNEEAQLIIEDNGVGFDIKNISNNEAKGGMGIHGLIERFELIRGNIVITSSPNKGTRIVANAPKDPVKLIGDKDESN